MSTDEPMDGPRIGDLSEGQMLVAVGMEFTFTDAHEAHREAFAELDQWMTGIRLYSLEEPFDSDGIFWDELEHCGYSIGEGETIEDGKTISLYDVWTDAGDTDGPLKTLRERLLGFRNTAVELLPPGLRGVVDTHETPLETLKLIAQLAE